MPKSRSLLLQFAKEARGSASVELVIILPMLLWALAATVVFYDGFRTRYHAQMAAQTVADIMSRETDLFTADYVEGINAVFDFLVDARVPTRLRVSSVIWDSENQRNRLQWSYGTRDISALPQNTFELMQAGDLDALVAEFGADESFSFAGAAAQMPVADLPDRIPPVLPGEALLMVESFALWTPFTNVGLGQIRFTPMVVVRPRFAPWVNFEGVDPIFPEDYYEISWTGDDDNPTLPDPDDPDDPDPDQPGAVTSYTFDSGGTAGWSGSTISSRSSGGGSFLGPFGRETYDNPVTLAVDLGAPLMDAQIEFDLLIIDDWDGFRSDTDRRRSDTLSLLIDGVPITLDAFSEDNPAFYANQRFASGYLNGMQYQAQLSLVQSGTSFFGNSDWDSVWHVSLSLAHAPEQFKLGFSAGTDSDVSEESFGIDSLTYTATTSAASGPFFGANAAAYSGRDSYTRFERFSGCPEFRIAAPWLTLTNEDADERVRLWRRAGGSTDLQNCSGLPGLGYVSAAPQMVLQYDNQGRSGDGRRLRLTLNDRNNGYTCDSVLLVRDPNGQWWFNDDLSGYNAGLRFGNAQSGQYAIWLGTYNSAECDVIVRFSTY